MSDGDTRKTIVVRIIFPAFGRATCICQCGARGEILALDEGTSTNPGRPRRKRTAAELADEWAMRHVGREHQCCALVTEAEP